jgi:hypothetical protein
LFICSLCFCGRFFFEFVLVLSLSLIFFMIMLHSVDETRVYLTFILFKVHHYCLNPLNFKGGRNFILFSLDQLFTFIHKRRPMFNLFNHVRQMYNEVQHCFLTVGLVYPDDLFLFLVTVSICKKFSSISVYMITFVLFIHFFLSG